MVWWICWDRNLLSEVLWPPDLCVIMHKYVCTFLVIFSAEFLVLDSGDAQRYFPRQQKRTAHHGEGL
jgi:hypothetical protein